MQEITSTKNDTLKNDVKLHDKKYRDSLGLFLVEGKKLIFEGVKNGFELVRLYVDKAKQSIDDFENFSDKTIHTNSFCIEKLYDEKSGQGVVGVFEKKTMSRTPVSKRALVLENLQDPKNVGALTRTAAACDFLDVFLINCTDPFSPKAIRTSMSGVFKCNFIEGSIEDFFKIFKGYELLCGDMGGENIFNATVRGENVAVAVGNEGNGVTDWLKEKAGKIVSIPMKNDIESLNVALSGGIIMMEILRKNS